MRKEKKYKKKTIEEKQLQKRNNVDQKWWMPNLMRSHNLLKTYSLSPSMLEENHVDVCLPE